MALTLPAGFIPTFQPLTDEAVLVAGVRSTGFRYELLDNDDAFLDELTGVQPGGSLDWTANASVKGAGKITVTDLYQRVNGAPIDWLNVRIRPVMTIEGYSQEIPLGVWLPAAPVEKWDGHGRVWEVELLDKSSILDGDVWSDPTTGEVRTYSAVAGANVVNLVREIISGAGEDPAGLEDDPTVLNKPLVWELGTTRLKIINDLLDAAGFFSLWVDLRGNFRMTKYVKPQDRAPIYESLGPFRSDPDTSIWSPEFTIDADIYAVPNRYVAVSQGEGSTPAMVGVATNTSEKSRYSYQARGRWITQTETGVEAATQEALNTYALRKLIAATSVTATIEVEHAYLPGLKVNDVVQLRNPDAGLDLKVTVTKTEVVLDPVSFVKSTFREVTEL